MSEIENLISDLQKQISTLTKDLEESQEALKYFEQTGKVWMKGYKDLEAKYERDIGNRDTTISQLQEELAQLQERYRELLIKA